MSGLYKKVELFTNIAIIAVAILFGAVLVQQYIIGSSHPDRNTKLSKGISAGEKISLPNVDWEKSHQTLLLVVSPNCHFCSESVPFYKKLVLQAASAGDIRLVAVLPQPINQGRKYLNDLGVEINEVEQADLSSIQVSGTPTLILVNSQGVVTDVWLGKLLADRESEVMNKMQCDTCGS